MDNNVIYEDETILILNKPAGITVNRSETTKEEETIQDWSELYLGIKYSDGKAKFGEKDWKPEDEFYKRGGIVHRLDKETSGILVIAKTPNAFVNLQKQFKDRTVKKTYSALAHGILKPSTGEISVPVGRLPWNRKRFGVLPGGRESKTLYTVEMFYQIPKSNEKLSYVKLYPQSGRTHQIRVHLKYINNPIFSDYLYAGRKIARSDRKLLSRVFLHAEMIHFIHPLTEKKVSFIANLPEELASFILSLEKVN